jgi:hypothetical protein
LDGLDSFPYSLDECCAANFAFSGDFSCNQNYFSNGRLPDGSFTEVENLVVFCSFTVAYLNDCDRSPFTTNSSGALFSQYAIAGNQ